VFGPVSCVGAIEHWLHGSRCQSDRGDTFEQTYNEEPMLHAARFALITLAAVVGLSEIASCQPAGGARPALADSTVGRIMATARRGFRDDVVVEVLRQRHQAYPVAKRLELADSVVALVVGTRGAADAALTALAVAGYAADQFEGVPDASVMDRLQEIHRTATSVTNRIDALSEMPYQIQPVRALSYLRSVAVSPTDPTAQTAIEAIGELAFSRRISSGADRQEAELTMRELFDRDLVPQGPAKTTLCRWVRSRRWPTANKCNAP